MHRAVFAPSSLRRASPVLSRALLFLLIGLAGPSAAIDESMIRALLDTERLPVRQSGSSLNQASQAFQSTIENTPYVADQVVDSTYLIGPGDFFQIFIEYTAFEKQVNPEGNIVLNNIGVIKVEGLTLSQAKALLLKRIGENNIKSQCYVNLSRLKAMKVFVTGAVRIPGIYQVSGNYRISDAIYAAGGLSNLAQRSGVLLISLDSDTTKVSVEEFLLSGDLSANPYLIQGATVYVPFVDFEGPLVTLRRDSLVMEIQLAPGESLADIVPKMDLFGAQQPFALVKVTEKDGSVHSFEPGQLKSYKPQENARIEIVTRPTDVFVGGAVLRPGYYFYRSNRRVIEYVSEAGILSSSRVARKMTVFRPDGSKHDVKISSTDLKPGDMILVKENTQQKFLVYAPVLVTLASLALATFNVIQATSSGP